MPQGQWANSTADGNWAEVARSIRDSEVPLRVLLAGKGYVDPVMVPLRSSGNIPGVVVEIKWGSTPEAAVAQIRERGYANLFRGTSAENNVVLCGIVYDPRAKTHAYATES